MDGGAGRNAGTDRIFAELSAGGSQHGDGAGRPFEIYELVKSRTVRALAPRLPVSCLYRNDFRHGYGISLLPGSDRPSKIPNTPVLGYRPFTLDRLSKRVLEIPLIVQPDEMSKKKKDFIPNVKCTLT